MNKSFPNKSTRGIKYKLITNYIFNSSYQITRIIVPLITTPYLSRVIGAEGVGSYAYSLSVASYFSLFIKLGLDNYGNRTIAYFQSSKESRSKAFWSIYTSQAILGTIMSVAYLFYCFYLQSSSRLIALIMIPFVLSNAIDISWFFFGMEDFKKTALRDIFIKIISTILIFMLVKNSADVWIYCLIVSLSSLVSQLLLWPMISPQIQFYKPSFKEVFVHLKPNLVLFIPTIAVSIYKTLDKIMLGLFSTEVEVGFYQNSEQIIQIPIAFVTSLGAVMLPRAANLYRSNAPTNSARKLFRYSILIAMFLSSSLCFGIMTVAPEFVPLFYGPGFSKCIKLFYILLPSCLFSAFANVIRTQYLIPREKDKEYILSLLSGAAVNVIVNLVLIPKLGSIGAAIGTLIAEVVVCLVQIVQVRKDIRIFEDLYSSLPFIGAGIVMFISSNFFNFKSYNLLVVLLIKVIIGVGTYLISLIVFLSFSNNRLGFKRLSKYFRFR